MSLTTFRRDGTPVATPVWVVDVAGTPSFTTMPGSGKIRRIRDNPDVQVAACDISGLIVSDAPTWRAKARLVEDLAGVESVRAALVEKYGDAARKLGLTEPMPEAVDGVLSRIAVELELVGSPK